MALRQEDLYLNYKGDPKKLNTLKGVDEDYFKWLAEEGARRALEVKPVEKSREQIKESHKKKPLYRSYEYSEKDMFQVVQVFEMIKLQNGSFPRNAEESLLKRNAAWMRAYLFSYDHLTTGRWNYWSDILTKGTLEGSGPIPEMYWCNDDTLVRPVKKMLSDCINGASHYGGNISHFMDWLLWGLAGHGEPPRIDKKIVEHFYRTFDLFLVLKYPTDYLSGLLEEATSRGHAKSLGYFSTPPSITQLMTRMQMSGQDPEEMKMKSVYDPCVGCGAMLLPMSDFCFFAAGQDINPDAVKACKIQFYWYAPWFVANPFPFPKV